VSNKCVTAASELYPDTEDLFNNAGLSHMTMQQRIADISKNLHDQFQNKAAIFKYYSLASDKKF